MAKKDLTYFVRFGSLDLKTQKGYSYIGKDDTFHAPPASRGFYAMPYIAQEFFLIGSLPNSTQPEQFPKSPQWNEKMTESEKVSWEKLIDDEDYWNAMAKRDRIVRRNIRKEFRKTKGFIWHHLIDYVDNCNVVQRHSSWVKTSIKTWQKAFRKCCLTEKTDSFKSLSVNTINEVKSINGCYSKDHYEVFFDEKV